VNAGSDALIPSFEVSARVDVDLARISVPPRSVLFTKDGLMDNHFYAYLGPISWGEYDEIFAYEGELLAEADSRSVTPEEFEEVIYELDDEGALGNLDAGIASPVYALYAFGCFPFTSCRGHPGERGTGDCPKVVFWCPKRLGRAVVAAATSSGVGLTNEETTNGDGLMVSGKNVNDVRRFSQALRQLDKGGARKE
jgi:hypothetical protein